MLEERGGMSEYIDAGYFNINPSLEAYRSVRQMHHNDLQIVKVLVSIGSGRQLEEQPAFASVVKVNQAVKQSKKTHLDLKEATKNRTDYFRLDVQHGLELLGFDEWKGKKGDETLKLIRTQTEEYLKSPEVRGEITEIAKQLVAIRRQRSTWEPDRWKRFCREVQYACPISTCQNAALKYTRRDLQAHLKATHSIEPDELESFLDAGKRFPLEKALQ